jgi:hypothetical protein
MPTGGNRGRDHPNDLGVESVDHHHEGTEGDHHAVKASHRTRVNETVEVGLPRRELLLRRNVVQNLAPRVIP